MTELPNAETLRSCFEYDPDVGHLRWLPRPANNRANKNFNARFAGKLAGTLDSWGHRQIKLIGTLHLAHRIIWCMVTGQPPKDQIDHINGNRDDNRWSNLRAANALTNAWNSSVRHHNKTGRLGVVFYKDGRTKPFAARIRVGGKGTHLGFFATPEEAESAYRDAFKEHRGTDWLRG